MNSYPTQREKLFDSVTCVAVPGWSRANNAMIGIDRNSQEALEEKARLLDLANDAILVRDASDCITFWNKGAAALYGFTREQAIGRVSHDLLRTKFPEALASIQ